MHPFYRDKYGYQPEDFPGAYDNYERMLSLPLHAGLSDRDVADVIEAVCAIVRQYRKRTLAGARGKGIAA
jgi:dTDP-4-amino-4,6-dideoxygalactose transaminase